MANYCDPDQQNESSVDGGAAGAPAAEPNVCAAPSPEAGAGDSVSPAGASSPHEGMSYDDASPAAATASEGAGPATPAEGPGPQTGLKDTTKVAATTAGSGFEAAEKVAHHNVKTTQANADTMNEIVGKQVAKGLPVDGTMDQLRQQSANKDAVEAKKDAGAINSVRGAAITGGLGGGAAATADTLIDLARGKDVSAGQAAANIAVGTGTGAGAAVATQQLARVAGKAAGPLVDGAVNATLSGVKNYGEYADGKQTFGEATGKTAIDTAAGVGAGLAGLKAGAAIGTFIGGPVGTAIGAGAGFLVGYGGKKLLGYAGDKLKNWLWPSKDKQAEAAS